MEGVIKQCAQVATTAAAEKGKKGSYALRLWRRRRCYQRCNGDFRHYLAATHIPQMDTGSVEVVDGREEG